MEALKAQTQRIKGTSPIKMETKVTYEFWDNVQTCGSINRKAAVFLPRKGNKSGAHIESSEYAHKIFDEMPSLISRISMEKSNKNVKETDSDSDEDGAEPDEEDLESDEDESSPLLVFSLLLKGR
ncbi:hypothetical protein U1Q18_046827 [Sarracenia purpurea var. burkii]